MVLPRPLWTILIFAGLSFACGERDSMTPTAPALPSVTATRTVHGEVSVATVTHQSGSILGVHDCGPAWSDIAGDHLCNDDWHGAFNVVIDRDLFDAVLTVTFEDQGRRCGEVYVSNHSFAANREQLVGTVSPIFLTYEPEGYDNLVVAQRCELPSQTTRLVVQVWDRAAPATPLLRREFDYAYTFAAD
jgi:hypothetical protein